MGESWKDLPDVVEAPKASWKDLPDAEAPPGGAAPPPPGSAPAPTTPPYLARESPFPDVAEALGDEVDFNVATGATTYTRPITEAEFRRGNENAKLKAAFLLAADAGKAGDAATVNALAEQLDLPSDVVLQHYGAIRRAAAEKADVDAWRAEHPELALVLLGDPRLAKMVQEDVEPSYLAKAWAEVKAPVLSQQDAALVAAYGGVQDAQVQQRVAAARERLAATQAQQQRELGPVRKEYLDDLEAQAYQGARKELASVPVVGEVLGASFTAAGRYQEAEAQAHVSEAGWRYMLAAVQGKDTTLLEREVHDAKLKARPRRLGDTSSLGQTVAEMAQGTQSTVQILGESLGAGEYAAAAGMLVGAGVGLAATRTPQGMVAGTMKGGALGARLGLTFGAGHASLRLEAGGAFVELGDVVTEEGNALTPQQRAGAALIIGAAATGLELVSLGKLAESFGPLGKMLKTGGLEEVKALLRHDPTFRRMAAQAGKEYLTAVLTEAGEEVGTEAATQGVTYVAKSLRDKKLQEAAVFDVGKLGAAGLAGLHGAMPLAGLGTAVNLASQSALAGQSRESARQVKVALEMGQAKSVQASPEAWAGMVAQTTAESGAPVTALYVPAEAIARYFQEEKGLGPEAAATQVEALAGTGAAQRFQEALVAGGRLEVPMSAVLSTWAASDVGKAVADSTTTAPHVLAPSEVDGEALKQREAEARRLAEDELARLEKESALETRVKAFEDAAAAARAEKVGPKQAREEARAAAVLLKHFMRTTAKDFDVAVGELFPETPVEVAEGDEAAAGAQEGRADQPQQSEAEKQDVVGRLVAKAQQLEALPEGRTRAFVDPLTGLRTLRGFGLQSVAPGQVVVALTSTDTKPLNDSSKLGHEQANRMLRALGGLVESIDAEGARGGTTFVARAGSREAALAAVNAWRSSLPAELRELNVSVGFGASAEDALGALDEQVDTGRAKGRRAEGMAAESLDAELIADNPDAPQLPALRTGTQLDLERLSQRPEALALGDRPTRARPAPQDIAEAAAKAFSSTADFARDQLLDQVASDPKLGPIILNKAGFEATGPRAWVVAFDGIGLKALNARFAAIGRSRFGMTRRAAAAWGKKQGDVLLVTIAQAAHAAGGAGVSFARLSGDEFAAKHDNREALLQFAADMQAAVQELSAGLSVTLPDGTQEKVDVDVRWGIGESTYAAADQDLAARKEGRRGPGGDAELPGAGTADERARRAQQRGILDARWGVDARPAAPGAAQEVGPKRVSQEGDDAAPPRGYTEIPEAAAAARVIRVFLNRSADVSTLLHESAHAFLELYGRLAERPDAPARVRETYAAALKWLGVERREDVTRAHHERWARTFEAYLLEGKAPSSALVRAFQRFKLWMMDVYRSLRGVPGADISDEVRGVFDALLATEDELEAFRTKQGPALRPATAEQQEEARVAMAESGRRAEVLALKDRLRVTEKWWEQGLEKLRQQYAEAYEALPARRAQRLLAGEDGGKPILLDRALVEAVVGKARVAGLKTVAEGGVRPSQVAEVVGFPSATTMLAALVALKPKERWVEEQARAEMAAQHPSVLEERTELRRLVADGLAAYAEERVVAEMKATPEEKATLKRAAELVAARTQVGRLHPSRALAAERGAARRKAAAAAKGEWAAARVAARQELLNVYLFRALSDAQQEVEGTRALAREMQGAKAQGRLGKAQPVYRDAVNYLLGAFGLGEEDEALSPAVLQQAVAQMQGDAVLIGEPEWLQALAAAPEGDFEALTAGEARQLDAALRNLRAAARHRTTVLVGDKRLDKEVAKAELLQEAVENKRPAPAVGARDFASAVRRLGGVLSAPLLKIEVMMGWLGGSLVGKNERESAHFRYVYRVLEGARQRESDYQKKVGQPILDALHAMPAELRRRLGDRVDGEKYFPVHGVPGARQRLAAPSTVAELLAMLLNAGNESNLDRLLRGRNITLEQLVTAFNAELPKEAIDWANAVLEGFESLWPEIQAMEERITGVKPEGLAKRPLALANGTLRGGYFPALYEPDVAGVGVTQQEAQAADLFHPRLGRPATVHGHTKSRVEDFAHPIALNLNAIPIHLVAHIHDLAFREPVMSVASLALDKEVQDAWFAALGPARAKQVTYWLRDAARVQHIDGADTAGWALGTVTKLRGNLSVAALGYSIPNMHEDLAGLLAVAADKEMTAASLARGVVEFLRAPVSSWRFIAETSAFMRSTDDSRVRDLTQGIRLLQLKGPQATREAQRLLELVKSRAFFPMELIFRVTAGPAWLARYRRELDEGGTEAAAVEAADALVRRKWPVFSPVNQPGVLRSKVLAPFVPFHSFFNTVMNVHLDEWQRILEAPGGVEKVRAALRLSAYTAVLALLGNLLRGRGPKEDEPPEEWAFWAMFGFMLNEVPLLGELGNLAVAQAHDKRVQGRPGFVGAASVAFVGAVDALAPGKTPRQRFRGLNRAGGLLLGLPSAQTERTGGYLLDVAAGEAPAETPADVYSGAVYGTPRESDSQLLRDFWSWVFQ